MRVSTGRWVTGNNFFDRERELRILTARVRDYNHTLITGQRRMGKTSIARELGRQLEAQEWIFVFANVEGAVCAEDVIAEIAESVHPVQPIAARFALVMQRWFQRNVEEISAMDFRIRVRAGLSGGSWRGYGKQLVGYCATYEKPVLLVIDELPIFLKRVLNQDNGTKQVDEFLSWLRAVVQGLDAGSLALVVSGSIGLEPLVRRLGIPDRINYLNSFRLGPWDRNTSIACFNRLAKSYELRVEDGVAEAVYEALGIGIPHHVQSFFERLREYSIMERLDRVMLKDVDTVYRTTLLGPSGQNDLAHYESRLWDALDDEHYRIAMEILAEAAIQNRFTLSARRSLEQLYVRVDPNVSRNITEVLEVLVHDGYLEMVEDGFRFPSRLLKDWWSARFREHHTAIEKRGG